MEAKKKKASLAVASVALVVVLAAAGTFAYLQDSTDDVINTFDTNKVQVELEETTGGEYNIVPGTTEKKDPTVTVTATVESYVFVEVTDTANVDGKKIIEYAMAEGWEELDGYKNVYYREVAGQEGEQYFEVLADNEVSYPASLTNADMPASAVTLAFKAYAIQKEAIADDAAEGKEAVTAYQVVALGASPDSVVATDEGTFSSALKQTEAGGSIILAGEVKLNSPLTIDKKITIVGDDNASIEGQYITTTADVSFVHVEFKEPTNKNSNASLIYAKNGTTKLVLQDCVFSNPQWEAIQVTSNDLKELVIDGCTFNADDVQSEPNDIYGSVAGQCIRYIHMEPSANSNAVEIAITNNTFNDIAQVADSIVGIYSCSGNITVGGNAFNDWADDDVSDGRSGKLSISWPDIGALKEISLWTSDSFSTHSFS